MGTSGYGRATSRTASRSRPRTSSGARGLVQPDDRSIENLLQTAAEKKRLEEELRIARQIQMSLLPRGPLEMPGLA